MTEMIPHKVPAFRPQDGDWDLIGSPAPRSWMQPT